jgi:SsrA-binding protein
MSSKSGGAKAARKQVGIKVVADNRRARYEYEILQTFEAGLALQGSEVKSLREGRTNLAEAYATMKKGELFLLNSNIPEYREANRFNHDPKRPRKLLLHSKEIKNFQGITAKNHYSIEDFSIRGRAIDILGQGQAHDKRCHRDRGGVVNPADAAG